MFLVDEEELFSNCIDCGDLGCDEDDLQNLEIKSCKVKRYKANKLLLQSITLDEVTSICADCKTVDCKEEENSFSCIEENDKMILKELKVLRGINQITHKLVNQLIY